MGNQQCDLPPTSSVAPACHGAREKQTKASVTLMSSFHVNQGHRVFQAEEEKERSVDGCGQL